MSKTIVGFSLAAFCVVGSVSNVRADDGFGSKLVSALSDVSESALAGLQEAVTGMGPGGNESLIDVTHTAVFDVNNYTNEEGIQSINYFSATGSSLEHVNINQFARAETIENKRGIQRVNSVMTKDSHLRNVTIDQVSTISWISNSEGIQQINTISINRAGRADQINITQVAKGERCSNYRGSQTINRSNL